MIGDLRTALRHLRLNPVFALGAIVTLALGIAATNTVFTIVNGALLRELPFDEPARVVQLGVDAVGPASRTSYGLSVLDLRDWQSGTRTFEGIAVYDERTMNLSDASRPAERFAGAVVSANAFTLLGQPPLIGRAFGDADDRDDAAPVVMLGHDVWRRRYDGDPGIVGSTIRVNGVATVVIGVMPDGFGFPLVSDVWTPLASLDEATRRSRAARTLTAFGRLRRGVSHEQAAADLRGVIASTEQTYPANGTLEPRLDLLRSGIGGPMVALLSAMLGAVGLVLLIACANVANLLLGRSAARAHEVSVRLAVGASRWRIVRQLLFESLILSVSAGLTGLALSAAAIRVFWNVARESQPPYWLQFPIDWRVLAFLATASLATTVLFGLLPALHTVRISVAGVLADAGRSVTGRRRGARSSEALVASQLALALVLLTGAGLMIRNFLSLATMDAGVDTSALVRLRLDLPAPAYASPDARVRFLQSLESRLAARGDMEATLASVVPGTNSSQRGVLVEGASGGASATDPATVVVVAASYFDTVRGVPLRGRRFVPEDGTPGRSAVIVNERFAAMHFGRQDPLGRRIQLRASPFAPTDTEWLTIVGVAPNIRQRSTRDGGFDPIAYLPLAADPMPGTNILARSSLPLDTVARVIQGEVRAIDADVPVFDVRTVDDLHAFQRWPQRVFGTMFGVFAAVALAMAAVGLYAVTAAAVVLRTREIGVRMALGAGARQIGWLMTKRVTWQLAAGVALGLVGAVAMSRALPLEAARDRSDAPTILVVTASLVLVAVLACLVPVRRALSVDPVHTLRQG